MIENKAQIVWLVDKGKIILGKTSRLTAYYQVLTLFYTFEQ